MELFLSNFVLFACISTHNLWRNKGFKFPWDLYWKNETYELKRSIVCFENLFIALLNSFSKCTFVVWNIWYNAYKECFFGEQTLKNFVIYKQFLPWHNPFKFMYCPFISVCGDTAVTCRRTRRTVSNKCCVFPFTYEGKQYDTCIWGGPSASYWCATTDNFDRDEQWDICKGIILRKFNRKKKYQCKVLTLSLVINVNRKVKLNEAEWDLIDRKNKHAPVGDR